MANCNIQLTIDIGCPWCYLGWNRLRRAVALYRDQASDATADTVTIVYRYISIDPTLPKVPVSQREHLLKKMLPETIDTVHSAMKSMGQKEGIKYNFNSKIGNTRDIHRLMYLARSKSPEVEERLLSIVFKSHFEEEGDITCHDTLVSYAGKAGISGADVRSWLDNGGGENEFEQDKLESRTTDITSVPHMLINGRSVSKGVPEVEVLLQMFTKQFSH
ncbi:thioredoxin-like protein [Fusarium oxysporum Fo47]|uniref:Uncharacterized protein n=1 Tax=Fusarium oxysporum Fo47 TaxID=660027 RepID=W9JEK0_FUSOX|nr:thioredoxin-like protein [Fusarium oxysporum Fo47]EWZ27908.1 hypothetical protein FOZG_18373 [Fusarium oxysporum Fo47]QKD56883.1 thioredoxin-like protein [Fusarium oxysporum Fo47]